MLHHPSGRAFAAAYAGRILVHSTLVPAALDAQGIDALPGWLSVEPDPPDITFSRGADVLRDAPARAFAAAAARDHTSSSVMPQCGQSWWPPR